jgi:hypothetical protein
MKYSTVDDIILSLPHPVPPTVLGEPDYQSIHATQKSLQANSRVIDTHSGGGTLGHLGLIISDAPYAMIAQTTDAGLTLSISPQAPERAPANTDSTSAQISATPHLGGGRPNLPHTHLRATGFEKQIISVFETMYLDVLNENMVGFTDILSREMMDHLFSNSVTSLPWILKSILNTCAEHGIPNSQLNPCSSNFKIVQVILRQAAYSLDTRSKMLATPKYLQLVTS